MSTRPCGGRARRMSIANALEVAEVAKSTTKRNARLCALLAKLTVVKSGGMQLLNHIVMFSAVISLLVITFELQPRTATLHAHSIIGNVRPLLTPSEREGSFAAMRALARLVEESRASPEEYSFVFASPMLLRHYPRSSSNFHRVGGTCTQDASMRVNFEAMSWSGLRGTYDPASGEVLELGTYDAERRSLAHFNASEVNAVLGRLSAALWLTPQVSGPRRAPAPHPTRLPVPLAPGPPAAPVRLALTWMLTTVKPSPMPCSSRLTAHPAHPGEQGGHGRRCPALWRGHSVHICGSPCRLRGGRDGGHPVDGCTRMVAARGGGDFVAAGRCGLPRVACANDACARGVRGT